MANLRPFLVLPNDSLDVTAFVLSVSISLSEGKSADMTVVRIIDVGLFLSTINAFSNLEIFESK